MAKSVKLVTFAFSKQLRCKNRVLVFGQETGTLIFCRALLNMEEGEAHGGMGWGYFPSVGELACSPVCGSSQFNQVKSSEAHGGG